MSEEEKAAFLRFLDKLNEEIMTVEFTASLTAATLHPKCAIIFGKNAGNILNYLIDSKKVKFHVEQKTKTKRLKYYAVEFND